MGKLGKLGAIVLACGLAGGAARYGWKATRARQIRVCAVTDYAYRQRPNWEESVAARLREVNRIFGPLKIEWVLMDNKVPLDPTAAGGSLDQRRVSLADALECHGDVKLSLTGVQAGKRTGSVNAFSRSLIVVDAPGKSDTENARQLAHSLANLFGAPIEPAGSNSIMTEPPESDAFSPKTAALIRSLRDYPFGAGIEGLTPEWSNRALKAIQAAMPEKTANPAAQANRALALALGNERKMDLALPYLREAQKLDPNNAYARAELAGALAQLSQASEALKEISEAVRLAPNDATLRAGYANVLARAGDPEAGIDEMRKAVEMAPNNLLFRVALASSLMREAGKIDEAIEAFREAVKVDPNSQFAVQALERAQGQKAKFLEDAARRRAEAAQAPVTFAKLLAHGTAELWAGNYDAATRAFEKAVEVEKANGRARAGLAAVRYLRKDYAGAWKEVKASRAVSFEPPAPLVSALKRKQPE